MSGDLASEIQAQIHKLSMDPAALQAKLDQLLKRKMDLANRTKSPQSKEQRQAAYQKAHGEEGSATREEWDRKRKIQADARRAKEEALKNLIVQKFNAGELDLSSEQLKVLGIKV